MIIQTWAAKKLQQFLALLFWAVSACILQISLSYSSLLPFMWEFLGKSLKFESSDGLNIISM